MPSESSSKRTEILAFIRRRIAAGQPPSLAEIAEAFGFASRNAAQKHVLALAEAGAIELVPNQKRGIRLPGAGRPELMALPVLGRVAAGAPIEPDLGQGQELWLDAHLFARRPDLTKAVAQAFPKKRIAPQFTQEGKLPLELARTRSLHYSIYALLAAYDVAEMARCVGIDLWNYSDGGKGLRSATDFLKPYYRKVDSWTLPELRPTPGELDELLRRARDAWGPDYPLAPETELKRYFGNGPAVGEGQKGQ